MTSMLKALTGTAVAAVAMAGMATPASAQYYDPYYDRERRDGPSIGQIIAGVGAVAGAVNAVTGRGGYYGYPQQSYRYGYPQSYGYGYPQTYGYPQAYGYGNAYSYGYGGNAAVNSCAAEAQRQARGGQVRISDVDLVSRGRVRVRGTFDELRPSYYGRVRAEREGFSCLAYGNGQIVDFDS